MQLIFRQLQGSEKTLTFEPVTSISSVKEVVSQEFHIPISNLRLLLKGKALKGNYFVNFPYS